MSNNAKNRCLICRNSISDFPDKFSNNGNISYRYHCPCCGFVPLSPEAVNYISTEGLISEKDKSIISICLRLKFEQYKQKENIDLSKEEKIKDDGFENFTVEKLKELISKYQPLAPLHKIANFLQIMERKTKSVGHFVEIKIKTDYPIFHCNSSYELVSLISFLHKDELIDLNVDINITDATRDQIKSDNILLNEKSLHDISSAECSVMITTKGLQRLKELTYTDKTDIFMKSAMNLAQKADEEKAASFEMVRIANREKLKVKVKLKETLLLVEKIKAEKELEKETLKQELLEIVRLANKDRDNAFEKVNKYKALIKKNVAVSDIAINRLKNQEQAKEKALKEIQKLKAEQDKFMLELKSAVDAKNIAEEETKKAIIQKQKALEKALLAKEEKKTAMLIAEKAKQVADNSIVAVKKAEREKKEAEAVAREALGKVMNAEYNMEKALKALHKAEEEKRDALKLAYGLC